MRMRRPNTTGKRGGESRHLAEPLNDERRELAAKYVPLALSLARKFSQDWFWLRDEMESAALVALVEAARTFDPERNVKFPTFLRIRLSGAMINVRRQMSQSFSNSESKESDDERNWVKTKSVSNLNSDEVSDLEERIIDGSGGDRGAELHEVRDSLRAEFRKLPVRHREVMDGIYLRRLSMDEVAEAMGCSKTRVAAVHRESIGWLIENRRHKTPRTARRRRGRPDSDFSRKTEPNRGAFVEPPDSE